MKALNKENNKDGGESSKSLDVSLSDASSIKI